MLPFLFLGFDQISNSYVLMVCKSLLPTFAAGFVIFCGLFDYIFVKMNLLEFEEYYVNPLENSSTNYDPERASLNSSQLETKHRNDYMSRQSLLDEHAERNSGTLEDDTA